MALTVSQAIGVGVTVGFAGSLILIAVILGISRIISAYSVPPNRVIAMQPQYSPAVLIPPPDAIEEINIGVRELSAPCELKEAENLAYHIEGFANFFFGSRFQRKPDVPESLFDESELVRLAGEPINGGTWSQSISNVSTRVPTIKCFLAQVLLKRMQPTCPVDDCLLPPEISSCYQLVCRVYDIPRRMRPIAACLKIAAWRESILMLQNYPWSLSPVACRPFEEGDPRKERMQAMVPVIINVLQPEALRTDHPRDDRFDRLLVDVLERAANSAIVLLGQPTEWEAVWSSTETGFIVHPGLRFVWQGKTKYSRPAVVDDELAWPIRPDDQGQPNSQSEEQPKSDAPQAPTHGSLQLCEPRTAEHSAAEHKNAKDSTAELSTAAYITTDC